jgi:hypothetical protein
VSKSEETLTFTLPTKQEIWLQSILLYSTKLSQALNRKTNFTTASVYPENLLDFSPYSNDFNANSNIFSDVFSPHRTANFKLLAKQKHNFFSLGVFFASSKTEVEGLSNLCKEGKSFCGNKLIRRVEKCSAIGIVGAANSF